ncbi:xanthine dehydrogenase accessory protein XdhC [Aquincola sp. S2]|uniref:Xanthine dehydrogenase accessory protein XdhC n=1 Tax=Pseudaquabacterium terrae TaxID=2732868 RepID=A0ABX2EEL6_9BURK|nr:xanthine dehydrogenase accessory protein XdhC [Aquabacterium terrae]NRF67044.1 xanthine dehydrogenase accessory protein XdhC [Aquabacterium terrae]
MSAPDSLQHIARRWLVERRPAMEVQVLDSRGSVPREAGTRMLVAADQVAGTIGGGHLELQAIADARAQLVAGNPAPHDRKIALGPTLGQCCGGALTLRTQGLTSESLAAWPAETPRFTLQLYGAGHVGRAMIKLLEGLNCKVQWIDERESEFPPEPSAAHIERMCVEPVEAEVAAAPPGCFYLVLTHSHELDLRITEAILKRADFGYLGLIGSQTKRARFLHRFEERGIGHEVLGRLTCPIGVPGIEGKEPEIIAIAVLAQLLQASA